MKSLLLVALTAFLVAPAFAQDAVEGDETSPFAQLDWHDGPRDENIAGKATLHTTESVAFLDEDNSRRFLQLTGNIPEDGNYIMVASEEGSDWWATFTFNPSGYVRDNEKIDADELLSTLKDSDGPANEYRRELGLGELHTVGWVVPPHYDTATQRLEWGLKLRSDEGETVNYTVRLLGRTGVMNATLVSDPETIERDVVAFKQSLDGFSFNTGETYAEFREGDRVAEYGLTALVAGGAVAIAAKSGFLAKFWKLIVGGGVALVAAIGKLFGRKKG